MATEPLTGARYPTQQDAPLGGLQIGYAVQDLASYSLPRFATAAARDAAYVNWVANGGTLTDGMRCIVGAYEMGRLSGIWRYMQGILVVPDRTARDNLATYDGLHVHQIDVGLTLRRVGGTWRLASAQPLSGANADAGNTAAGTNWQGTVYANVPTDLGSPVTVAADGIARTFQMHATASIAGDMWMVIHAIVGATNYYWPNPTGRRSIASANQEQPLDIVAELDTTGGSAVTIQLEAHANVTGSGSVYSPALTILAV